MRMMGGAEQSAGASNRFRAGKSRKPGRSDYRLSVLYRRLLERNYGRYFTPEMMMQHLRFMAFLHGLGGMETGGGCAASGGGSGTGKGFNAGDSPAGFFAFICPQIAQIAQIIGRSMKLLLRVCYASVNGVKLHSTAGFFAYICPQITQITQIFMRSISALFYDLFRNIFAKINLRNLRNLRMKIFVHVAPKLVSEGGSFVVEESEEAPAFAATLRRGDHGKKQEKAHERKHSKTSENVIYSSLSSLGTHAGKQPGFPLKSLKNGLVGLVSSLLVGASLHANTITQFEPVRDEIEQENLVGVKITNDDNGAIYDSYEFFALQSLANSLYSLPHNQSNYSNKENLINDWRVRIRSPPLGEVDSGWNETLDNTGKLTLNHNPGWIDYDYDGWYATQQKSSKDSMYITCFVPDSQLDGNNNGWSADDTNDYHIALSTNQTENMGIASAGDGLNYWYASGLDYLVIRNVSTNAVSGLELRFTNGVEITNNAIAAMESGTDFGTNLVGVGVSHRFSMTNGGTAALVISGSDITGDSVFALTGMPSVVDAGTASNFWISFEASTVGVYAADVVISNNTSNAVFRFGVSGEAVKREQVIRGG
ncbi:MAG: choice-of-anchor D domain-containing protein [Kiritimatiellae bacterium]|nr:choice-of-anchor D domain-containing protein [Kiritimatiellia bacterium]